MATRRIARPIYLFSSWPLIIIAKTLIRNNIWSFKHEYDLIHKQFQQSALVEIEHLIIWALIVAEDRRFYLHGGYDLYAIFRAMIHRVFYNKFEGGSTIEQQLVRTITGRHEISISRKIREIMLAVIVSDEYGKTDIAEIYLNIAHLGTGIYGIKQMSEILGIPLDDISISDTAIIISMLKYPRPSIPSPSWLSKHAGRSDWLRRELLRISLAPNPPLNSDFTCIGLSSPSTSRLLGAVRRVGTGRVD